MQLGTTRISNMHKVSTLDIGSVRGVASWARGSGYVFRPLACVDVRAPVSCCGRCVPLCLWFFIEVSQRVCGVVRVAQDLASSLSLCVCVCGGAVCACAVALYRGIAANSEQFPMSSGGGEGDHASVHP